MKKQKLFSTLALVLVIGTVGIGCVSNRPEDIPVTVYEENTEVGTNINDNDNSTGSYSGILNYLGAGENFVISPVSLNSALQIYEEVTDDEITKTNIRNLRDNVWFKSSKTGRDYINYKTTDTFKLVNCVWVNSNKDVNFSSHPYLDKIKKPIDMSQTSATDEKNEYVNKMTNGFIKSTPTVFNNEIVMDIMNVAYFKDTWADEFKDDTYETDFANLDGSSAKTTMFGKTFFDSSVREYDDAYTYELRYEDENYSMLVILPKDEFEININNYIDFEYKEDNYRYYDNVIFKMPNIDINCNWKLDASNEELANLLGLDGFCDSQIDEEIYKSDIGTYPMINQVVKVVADKEGTEAAAVTEIMVADNACIDEPSEPTVFEFICDKPFYFVIKDNLNEDVAFVGQVVKVTEQ